MGSRDSPWPLFCGDLELAQGWVWQQLNNGGGRCGQAAHWALSLGLHTAMNSWLTQHHNLLSASQQRGLRFRIARSQQHAHAHRQLFGSRKLTELALRWQTLQRQSGPLRIALQGGIGDHLQDLSALIPWARSLERPVSLHLSPDRFAQFNGLLLGSAADLSFSGERFPRAAGLHVLELMALLGADRLQAQAWIRPEPATATRPRLLCCWTALGTNDRFSAWSRSVPSTAVLQLYESLLARGWAAASIVDISSWREGEAALLSRMGISLINPAAGDVLKLAALVAGSQQVLSIDTALAHLCGAMGRKLLLLLPRFPDERWLELLQPGSSYAHGCQVVAQQQFGCWRTELHALSHTLSAGNPPRPRLTTAGGAATNG
jgi:hypothetical protein